MSEKTPQELAKQRICDLKKFKLSDRDDCPKQVVHSEPAVIKFKFQTKTVDLRTASAAMLEIIAKSRFSKVLTWNEGAKSSSSSSGPPAPRQANKETSTK